MTKPHPTPATAASAVFSARLVRRMAARGVDRHRLARHLGVTPAMVGFWRTGAYMPSAARAAEIAEFLDDGMLRTLVVNARTAICPNCQRTFDRTNLKKAYCSAPCQKRAWKAGIKKPDPRQSAIDLMCRECEPEGLCREAGCPLRPFSPLLLIRAAA